MHLEYFFENFLLSLSYIKNTFFIWFFLRRKKINEQYDQIMI